MADLVEFAAPAIGEPPLVPRRSRRIGPATAAIFAGYAALFAVLLHQHARTAPLWLAATAAVVFLVLVALLRRVRTAAWLGLAIVGGGLLLQIIAVSSAPTTSDDVYRYVWDGKVQFAGIDPYAYPPQAPRLAGLRDATLFGPTSGCTYVISGSCTVINRPNVHTVYPPVAEGAFDVVRAASGGGVGGYRAFQIAAAFGTTVVSFMLLRLIRSRGRPVWLVALWAWSPIVVVEFGNNAHIDWVAVLLALLALALAGGRRMGVGRAVAVGSVAGAAVLTKIYPVLLLPVLIRRRPVVVLVSAAGLTALSYLPHVLAVGAGVVGYLPGYLHEEGYASGSRFLLVGLVFPHPFDTIVGVAVLLAVAWWCWAQLVPERPEELAVILTGTTFLIVTPSFGWYAGLLIALIAWTGRWEWLPIAFAPTFVYLSHLGWSGGGGAAHLAYALAAAASLVIAVRRGSLPPPRRWVLSARAAVRIAPRSGRRADVRAGRKVGPDPIGVGR